MSFKKLIVSTVAAAALATGAFASTGATGTAADITVAADKTGDYLLFPTYFANSAGWKTDIRVVNTNEHASVIAKVVIREGVNSFEVRDFFIYLTPGDVWSGVISESDGTVSITSTDDSMIFNDMTAAEKDGGYTLPFVDGYTPDSDPQVATARYSDNEKGYIEIYGVAKATGTGTWTAIGQSTSYTDDLSNAPVDKHALYAAATTEDQDSMDYANWMPVGADDLTGQMVIYADNASGKLAMTSPATALENVTGDLAFTAAVMKNMLGQDTLIEHHSSYTNDIGGACNTVEGIEAALNKTLNYAIHYGDETIDESHFYTTFDMKFYRYQLRGQTCDLDEVFIPKTNLVTVNNTTWTSQWIVITEGVARDMEENYLVVPDDVYELSPSIIVTPDIATCDREVCKIIVENDMDTEGYVTYSIQGSTENDVIKTTMPYDTRILSAKDIGGTNVTNIITPAFAK